MNDSLPPNHRKLVKHDNTPGVAHELTWSCYQRRQLLNTGIRRDMAVDAIRQGASRHGYIVMVFVVMPEHVHLLARHPQPDYDMSELLYAIKRPSSFRFKQMMAAEQDAMLAILTIKDRPGKMTFRFWQEGPGCDRNFLHQDCFAAIRYIHLNPVRRGLCGAAEDWAWSSARWYAEERIRPDGGLIW